MRKFREDDETEFIKIMFKVSEKTMSIRFLAQVLEIIYYMCLVALPATISDIQYWVIIAHFYSV